jgi:hypothetical protein
LDFEVEARGGRWRRAAPLGKRGKREENKNKRREGEKEKEKIKLWGTARAALHNSPVTSIQAPF